MITPNVIFIDTGLLITVSWQVRNNNNTRIVTPLLSNNIQAPQFTNCTANIIMYKITVMDQYSPASITIPADILSVEFHQFRANNEYNVTVLAISGRGTSYPSDPVVVSKYLWRLYMYTYVYIHAYITT